MKKSVLIALNAPFSPNQSLQVKDLQVNVMNHLGIVGPNCSGKRSVLNALHSACKTQGLRVERVDFNTHRQAVTLPLTVSQLLGLSENTDLVIRFGLTNIWWRNLSSLSTGEIRKVLIAKAVSQNPDILFLERPFDGLDHKMRRIVMTLLEEITQLPSKVPKPLVQGIKWKTRNPVVLCVTTHRPETELPSCVQTLVSCQHNRVSMLQSPWPKPVLVPPTNNNKVTDLLLHPVAENQASLTLEPVLVIHRLTVFPSQGLSILDGKPVSLPILNRVSWTIHPREVWWLQGENGSSKSTLLSVALGPEKLLELAAMQHRTRTWKVIEDEMEDIRRKRPPFVQCTESVRLVSTESHMGYLEQERSPLVQEELIKHCRHKQDIPVILQALGLQFQPTERFDDLSFGEQRLLLIALAVLNRPRLLILDEPCHGLDKEHRLLVAQLVDRLCTMKNFDCACVFVTHQEDELPRTVSHRLVLSQGNVLSRGPYCKP